MSAEASVAAENSVPWRKGAVAKLLADAATASIVTTNEVPDCRILGGKVKLVAVVRKLTMEIGGFVVFNWITLTT